MEDESWDLYLSYINQLEEIDEVEKQEEVDPSLQIPVSVQIHTKMVCENVHEFREFLINEKKLEVGVYTTLSAEATIFEVEFYNKLGDLIDVLTCEYGKEIKKDE